MHLKFDNRPEACETTPMKDEIILNKAGNTYVGALASKLATARVAVIDGEFYRVSVGHIEPAVTFTPINPTPEKSCHGYTLLPLRWGTKSALRGIADGSIIITNK